jgi:hypothetical protein
MLILANNNISKVVSYQTLRLYMRPERNEKWLGKAISFRLAASQVD